jgi:WD40 repeat protein
VLLLAALGITEATGVTKLASTVVRLTTGSGTLVIETDDPRVKIAINDEEVTITGGGVESLTLRPGDYTVTASKNGESIKQELVSITRNGRTVVRMSLEPDGPGTSSTESAPAVESVVPRERTLDSHPGNVYAATFSPDGRWLATGGHSSVRVWNARTGALIHALDVPASGSYYAVTFSPDNRYLLTAPVSQKSEAQISVWDMKSGLLNDRIIGLPRGVFQLSFGSDGRTLMACGYFEFVRVWDFPSRRKVRDIPCELWARSVVASSKGKIAIGSSKKVTLAESDGTVIGTGGDTAPYAFSPDGRKLAGSTWREGRVTIWDGETLDELGSWDAHEGNANTVAISPNGRILATTGGDGKVRLWDVEDVESHRLLAEVSHDAESYGVSFSPDGKTLATTGYDKLVKLWNVSAIIAEHEAKEEASKPYQWPAVAPPPAIAPCDAEQAKAHQAAWAKSLGVPVERKVDLGDGEELTMMLIPPGEFLMGSAKQEQAVFLREENSEGNEDRISSEGPQHRVQITRPFYLGKYVRIRWWTRGIGGRSGDRA